MVGRPTLPLFMPGADRELMGQENRGNWQGKDGLRSFRVFPGPPWSMPAGRCQLLCVVFPAVCMCVASFSVHAMVFLLVLRLRLCCS